MKFIYTLLLALVVSTSLYAQSEKQFSKTVFSKEISFVRTDTAHGSQSTVIEYPKFLVVIELPMIDEGGGRSTNLVEDIPKAERFLNYLKKEYNNKPIKYVLSSHWHLHSLSGITPFFNEGAILVAAKTNWEYSNKNGLFGKTDTKAFENQMIQLYLTIQTFQFQFYSLIILTRINQHRTIYFSTCRKISVSMPRVCVQ